MADAVVHTAFNHDFSKFLENCEQDRRVNEALGSALEGSDKPLLVTSGLSGLARGATESDLPKATAPRKSEAAARAVAHTGVRTATIRLAPSVHGIGDHGFVPILVRLARAKGVSAYPGLGQNCWADVYRDDAARIYRLALEQGVAEPVYHAVADEAVPFKAIAELLGKKLGLPGSGGARGWRWCGNTGALARGFAVQARRGRAWTAGARLEAVITTAAMNEAATQACPERR